MRERDRIEGWKSIADFIGWNRARAARYHARYDHDPELRLPVYRLAAAPGFRVAVYARAEDLLAWEQKMRSRRLMPKP